MTTHKPVKKEDGENEEGVEEFVDLKTYDEILEISRKNKGVLTTFKNIETSEIFQQRVSELNYERQDAVIAFVQNVTNV